MGNLPLSWINYPRWSLQSHPNPQLYSNVDIMCFPLTTWVTLLKCKLDPWHFSLNSSSSFPLNCLSEFLSPPKAGLCIPHWLFLVPLAFCALHSWFHLVPWKCQAWAGSRTLALVKLYFLCMTSWSSYDWLPLIQNWAEISIFQTFWPHNIVLSNCPPRFSFFSLCIYSLLWICLFILCLALPETEPHVGREFVLSNLYPQPLRMVPGTW